MRCELIEKMVNCNDARNIASNYKINIFGLLPAHKDIHGNDTADSAAKEASRYLSVPNTSIPITDFRTVITIELQTKLSIIWSTPPPNKLRQIKSNTYFDKHPLEIAEERKSSSAGSDLAILTHSFISYAAQPDPIYDLCKNQLTVLHLFQDCPKYFAQRIRFSLPSNLSQVLQITNPRSHIFSVSSNSIFFPLIISS